MSKFHLTKYMPQNVKNIFRFTLASVAQWLEHSSETKGLWVHPLAGSGSEWPQSGGVRYPVLAQIPSLGAYKGNPSMLLLYHTSVSPFFSLSIKAIEMPSHENKKLKKYIFRFYATVVPPMVHNTEKLKVMACWRSISSYPEISIILT